MALLNLAQRLFTVAEYNRMVEVGVLKDGERVELVEGVIVGLSAHNPAHSDGVASTTTILVDHYGKTHKIRCQLPLEVSPRSELEPDFAVVPKRGARKGHSHPNWAPLVIEVSNTSLSYDRKEKGSLYARAGIPDYWILNVTDRCLEVYREPAQDGKGVYGWAYQSKAILQAEDFITACALEPLRISVAEMLGAD